MATRDRSNLVSRGQVGSQAGPGRVDAATPASHLTVVRLAFWNRETLTRGYTVTGSYWSSSGEKKNLIINHYSSVLCIFLTDCLFIYYISRRLFKLLNNQTKIISWKAEKGERMKVNSLPSVRLMNWRSEITDDIKRTLDSMPQHFCSTSWKIAEKHRNQHERGNFHRLHRECWCAVSFHRVNKLQREYKWLYEKKIGRWIAFGKSRRIMYHTFSDLQPYSVGELRTANRQMCGCERQAHVWDDYTLKVMGDRTHLGVRK